MRRRSLLLAGLLGLVSCTPGERACESAALLGPEPVLFVGTSLTDGLGVSRAEAYPALLEARIRARGLPYQVMNAGVSGETSAEARARLPWVLEQPFGVLVLETGANDLLQGLDPAAMRRNLSEMVREVRSRRPQVPVLLLAVEPLPFVGRRWSEAYPEAWRGVAEEYDLPLVEDLLDGVLMNPSRKVDEVHPNAAGHQVLAETVWEELEPLLLERCRLRLQES